MKEEKMENFVHDRSSKIIFGKDTEDLVGKEVKRFTNKIMLHYGSGSIKKSGLYDRVMKSLEDEGIEVIAFGGVQPNPRLNLAREGIKIAKEEKVGLILAVGGGSAIDSAKTIALGALYDGDVWDFAEQKAVAKEALPVGVILTLPATGSESSQYAVITNEDGPYPLKRDILAENNQLIRPEFAILNPVLTYTLPPFQTACGVTDILAHVMERYFTSVRDVDFTDRLCEATMKTVINNGLIVMEEPENYSARAEIMWAGSIAHNDLLGTGRAGDFASHMIEHELSALYDIAHGAGLAIIFPAWMKYVYRYDLPRFAQFAERVWNVDDNYFSMERMALEAIKRMTDFFKELRLPTTLKEADLPAERFEEMAEKAVKLGSIKKMTAEDIVKIFKLAAE
jgi:alcohol dehydrogenase YqhD (iron-dependent ADH family)